jgi:hypothetical protein
LCEFLGDFLVVPIVLGFCSFLFFSDHPDDLAFGPIMAPFSIISRIILILVDSMAVFSGTIVTLEIHLVPLIGKESNELTVLNKVFDQNPQGNAHLDPMSNGIMECTILVCELRIQLPQYWHRLLIHRISLYFLQNIHDWSVESGPVVIFERLSVSLGSGSLSLLIVPAFFLPRIPFLLSKFERRGAGRLGSQKSSEHLLLVDVLLGFAHEAIEILGWLTSYVCHEGSVLPDSLEEGTVDEIIGCALRPEPRLIEPHEEVL